MPWNLLLLEDCGIVETHYVGMLTPEELEAAMRATLALAEESNCTRLLGDCRQLAGGHAPGDLYRLATIARASPLGNRLREAVLVPSDSSALPKVRFWETTALNRGLQVALFSERDQAVAWLCQDLPGSQPPSPPSV